jgi:hypothetical protein
VGSEAPDERIIVSAQHDRWLALAVNIDVTGWSGTMGALLTTPEQSVERSDQSRTPVGPLSPAR